MIWSSQLHFSCPIPNQLKQLIKTTEFKPNSLYVDLIPIRTLPRYGSPSDFLGPRYSDYLPNQLDLNTFFGKDTLRILPSVESSGRLANIPVCPSGFVEEFESDNKESTNIPEKVKISSLPKQTLSSCTWAATSFYTRSNQAKVNDGKRRLKEWTQHQLNVGFDHVYVFDNSGAFTNDDDLKDVTSLFGSKYVTRIPWVSC